MQNIILVAHNLRSCHNVGSLLRTAEGLGVNRVVLSGYTPYPVTQDDPRLPHVAQKITRQISKTALGAETLIPWQHADDIHSVIRELRAEKIAVFALEQTHHSQSLPGYTPTGDIAIVVGREVKGLEPEVIQACDGSLEIPMRGRKESFNVVQAAAMCLYHLTYIKPGN